jgi:hypothetical protein
MFSVSPWLILHFRLRPGAGLTSTEPFHRVRRSIEHHEFTMTRMETETTDAKAACERLIELLRGQNKKARFMTEVYAALERFKIPAADTDRALAELEGRGAVMVRANFCADPHLAGADLRVVALVESRAGEDPQMSAIRAIDETWNKWLSEYLANHRCG